MRHLFTQSLVRLQTSTSTPSSIASLCRHLRDNKGSVLGAWRGLAALDIDSSLNKEAPTNSHTTDEVWNISADDEWKKLASQSPFQGQVLVLSVALRIAQLPSSLDAGEEVLRGGMVPILKDLRDAIVHITNHNSQNTNGGGGGGSKKANGGPRLAIVAAEILALIGMTTTVSPSQEVFGEEASESDESIGSVSITQINNMSIACAHAVARGIDKEEILRLSSKIKGDIVTFLVEHYPSMVAPDTVMDELSISRGGENDQDRNVPMSVTHNIATFTSMREYLTSQLQQSSPTRAAYAKLDALRMIANHLGTHPHLTVAPVILSTIDDPSILLGSVTSIDRRREMLAGFNDNPSFLLSRGMLQDVAAIISSSILTTTTSSSQAQWNFELFVESVGSIVASPSSQTLNVPSKLTLTFECPHNDAPVNDDDKSIKKLLVSLAPRCAFWCAVVDGGHFTAPVFTQTSKEGKGGGMVGVFDVMFPREHLCVTKGCCVSSLSSDTTTATPPTIIFEDDDIIIVNKPRDISVVTHLLSHTSTSTEGSGGKKCDGDLVSWLLSTRPTSQEVVQTGIVHRLDKGTSGVLVVAKNNDARSVLKAQFGSSKDGGVKKYIALCKVVGSASELSTSGVVEEDVEQRQQHDHRSPSSKRPSPSYVVSTSYRILRHFAHQQIAVVEATITQGKKHQVRRHLQSVGLPLLGDVRYGGRYSAHPRFETAALHAQQIAFKHPRTQERMVVSCDLPTSTKKVLAFWGQMERVFKRNLKKTTGKATSPAKSNFNNRR